MRPIAEVVADIRNIAQRHFVFWDDNFFGDVNYARELLTALRPLRKRWAAQVSIDRCADASLLQLARAAGCLYLFIGLESFSAAGLKSVDKAFNHVARYQATVDLIHRHGICVQAGIIFGLDTDTPTAFANTLQGCEALGLDGTTVSVLTPLPGTGIYDEMQRDGRLLTTDWTWFNGKTRIAFTPRQMTPDELWAGYQWFRRSFYSFRSIARRLAISKTNPVYFLMLNLGYRLAL